MRLSLNPLGAGVLGLSHPRAPACLPRLPICRDFERALEHLHCFSMIAPCHKPVTETGFLPKLTVLIAQAHDKLSRPPRTHGGLPKITKINKNIPNVVIFGARPVRFRSGDRELELPHSFFSHQVVPLILVVRWRRSVVASATLRVNFAAMYSGLLAHHASTSENLPRFSKSHA